MAVNTGNNILPSYLTFSYCFCIYIFQFRSVIPKYADFVLKLERIDDLGLFIEQVKHYLEDIEKR